jgi:Domain of unknown function (DUF1876)
MTMTNVHSWTVDIMIDEHEEKRFTHAKARLQTDDSEMLVGDGMAHRNPGDSEASEIGDQLAVARALADLAHQLQEAAARGIEEHARTLA